MLSPELVFHLQLTSWFPNFYLHIFSPFEKKKKNCKEHFFAGRKLLLNICDWGHFYLLVWRLSYFANLFLAAEPELFFWIKKKKSPLLQFLEMSLPVNDILFPPLKWLLHDHSVGQGWDGFKNTFQICINAIYFLPGSLSKAAFGFNHISSRHALDHKKTGLGSIQQRSQDLSKHKSWLSHSVTSGMLVPKDQPLDCDSTRMFTLVQSIPDPPGELSFSTTRAETEALHKS